MSDTIPQDIPLKQCLACLNFFPATSKYFLVDKTCHNGLRNKCKRCKTKKILKEPIPEGMKKCSECKNIHPATTKFFYANKHFKSGLSNICKVCSDARRNCYSDEHQEQEKARKHQWYEANYEKMRELQRQYQLTHKEEIAATAKEYHQRNFVQIALWQKQYALSHQQYLQEYWHEYRRINREQRNANNRNRNAHKKSIPGTHTEEQILDQLKRQKYRCYYAACGFAKFPKVNGKYIFHVEHTYPISRMAGTGIPANDISYLVLACPKCNGNKGSKFPWEWSEGGRLM